MPIEKQDFEEEFEKVLLDSEERVQVDNSETGSENRCRELEAQTRMYSAISDHNYQIGQLENEKLKIEKDSEVKTLEIKTEAKKGYIETGVGVLTGFAGGVFTWTMTNLVLDFERTDSISNTPAKEIIKNFFRNASKGIRF